MPYGVGWWGGDSRSRLRCGREETRLLRFVMAWGRFNCAGVSGVSPAVVDAF